ncbi:MAG: hypothetical protein ND866_27060 [Pyrinomonadaceae bacterium]|nr:hypothetical protein [Pyrinomonadaceae bacterium]
MKIIAVIVLILGIGLTVLGAGYFFSSDGELCQRYDAAAKEKLAQAEAAQGTPREAKLMEEARLEVDSAERACRNARSTRQSALLATPGGIIAIVSSGVLLVFSRRRKG